MLMPEMKREHDLSPVDFVRQPVWVGVHNYDSDEPWYEQSDEETFRPWIGPLPFAEKRGFVLVAATFDLADGSIYPGYCRSVRDDWDRPLEPTPMRDGTQSKAKSKPQSWSSMHGGNQLSVLLLQSPTIFIDGRQFDFQLRIPRLRKSAIQNFYAAIGKKPSDVFPLRFTANSGLAADITSGTLDGFYSFPISTKTAPKTRSRVAFEIDTGEAFLLEGEASYEATVPAANNEPAAIPGEVAKQELELEDFQLHPVWVVVPFHDDTKRWNAQFTIVPWTGSLPLDSKEIDARISGTFFLRDGSQLPGYVRPVPENWADIVRSPTTIGSRIIQGVSAKVRYGGSPLAIIGEQRPCVFFKGQRFPFWFGGKDDPDELRPQFYKALRKQPGDIFPIRFEGAPGLATGIVSGEMNGFYLLSWPGGKPRIYVEV